MWPDTVSKVLKTDTHAHDYKTALSVRQVGLGSIRVVRLFYDPAAYLSFLQQNVAQFAKRRAIGPIMIEILVAENSVTTKVHGTKLTQLFYTKEPVRDTVKEDDWLGTVTINKHQRPLTMSQILEKYSDLTEAVIGVYSLSKTSFTVYPVNAQQSLQLQAALFREGFSFRAYN